MTALGKLERIPLIREIWKKEAQDFTQWLAKVENLSILSEALGLGPEGLQLEAREKGVGSFSADLVCRDTNSQENSLVLIECQFGQSDHDHLGKLLTYGGGLKARTVVLVGEKIRQEHKAALEWLNDITDDSQAFFACELELWRIGISLPAPRFNIVVEPNEWSRNLRRTIREESVPSENALTYKRFWQAFIDHLGARNPTVRPRTAAPQHWMDYPVGRANISIQLELSQRDRRNRISLFLQSSMAKHWFDELEIQKAQIEDEFGTSLEWDRLPSRQSARIYLMQSDVDPANERDWKAQHHWLADHLERFQRIFGPRVRQLSGQNSL